MNITTHIMELFRAMREDEQLELVAQIGAELSAKGIDFETLTGKPLKPKAKASGKAFRKGWWMKRVESYDPKKKGVFAIEGDWLSEGELSGLTTGDLVVIGWKDGDGDKKYMLARSFQTAMPEHAKEWVLINPAGMDKALDHLDPVTDTVDRFSDLLPTIKLELANYTPKGV